jgi:hypothetical protein
VRPSYPTRGYTVAFARTHFSAIYRAAVIVLAMLLVSIGAIVFAAPAAAGVPVIIDDFAGNTLGTRTVTNGPTQDSTTSPGTFSQTGGLGTMTSNGNGNTTGYTNLDYDMATAKDLTAGGTNKQFFLEFASIFRSNEVNDYDTAAMIHIAITDAAGHVSGYGTSISNVAPFNVVLNFFCDVNSVCFTGNADFTTVKHIQVSVTYPTNADPTRGVLTSVIDTIRTTPLGGAVPNPLIPTVTTASTTIGSLTNPTVHFQVAYTGDGSPVDVAGLTKSGLTVTGTAGGVSNYSISGGPTSYDVAVGPLTSSGTAQVSVNPAAVTDNWGQPGGGSSSEPVVNFTKWVVPAITASLTRTVTVGTPVSYTIAADGVPNPQFSVTSGALPNGLSLSSAGLVSGTPAVGSGGIHTVTIKALNSAGNDSKTFTFTVDEAASFTSSATASLTVGATGTYTITTRGYPVPTIAMTPTPALPNAVTFVDNGDGTATVSGKPDAATGAGYSLALTASNGIGSNGTQALALSVLEAPVVTLSPIDHTVKPGDTVSFTSTARGYPLPTVQWQRSSAGGTFANIVGATSTTYSFVAAVGDAGYAYKANFHNSTGDAAATATLTVQEAPTITSAASTTFVEGTNSSFTVTTTALPIATITATGMPSWLTVTDHGNGTATVSGTAPFGSAGAVISIPLTASNAVDPVATQTLAITVDLAPTIVTNPASTTVVPGATVNLSASAGGYPTPTVQWQRSTDGGVNFTNLPGKTALILSLTAVLGDSGDQYRAVFTNEVASTPTSAATVRVGTAPLFTSSNSVTFDAGVLKSFTIATSGAPAATIGHDTLPAWLTFTANGDGTATLTGTAPTTAKGSSVLALTASNTFSPDAAQSLAITVDASPTITSGASTLVDVGSLLDFTVQTDAGFPVSTGISETGVLPDGVTFVDNGDGSASLSGTPAAGAGGDYALTISAMAKNGTTSATTQSFDLVVNESPKFTSAASTVFEVGVPNSSIVTTGAGFPTLTAISEAGLLPLGLSFTDNGNGTATITGTPLAGTSGDYSLTLSATATGGDTADATQTFDLMVNQSPSITSADHALYDVGSFGTFTVTTTAGFPVATLVSESGNLPTGVGFIDNGDGTATISGTPSAGTGGSYNITISATAKNGTTADASQSFTLTINESPSITSVASATFVVGTSGTATIATTAGFPTATEITESGLLPSGVTFTDNGDGSATITGTPDAGTGGDYPLALEATATGGDTAAATQSFDLVIDESPSFTSGATTTFAVGTAGTFTVETTPGFPTATEISDSGSLPAGVTMHDNNDGTATIAGTPQVGSGGDYPLTLTATAVGSQADSTTQSFDLVIDESPNFTSATTSTFVAGQPGTFTVTTTTGWPAATQLDVTGALPSGVSFTDNGDGTATITGTSSAVNTYPLTFTASNGLQTSVPQNFTLYVATPAQFTGSADATFTVGVSGSTTITTTPGLPATTSLSIAGSLPAGLTFVDNGDGTATVAGTAAPGSDGSYPVTYAATNGTPPDSTVSGTITVAIAAIVPLPPSVPTGAAPLDGVPSATTQGEKLTISGSGFAAGSPVDLGIYSTPTPLGEVITDASGAFSATVLIPKFTGHHTLVVAGTDPTGATMFLSARTTITPAATGLAFTGADGVQNSLSLALELLVAGLAIWLIATLRRRVSGPARR